VTKPTLQQLLTLHPPPSSLATRSPARVVRDAVDRRAPHHHHHRGDGAADGAARGRRRGGSRARTRPPGLGLRPRQRRAVRPLEGVAGGGGGARVREHDAPRLPVGARPRTGPGTAPAAAAGGTSRRRTRRRGCAIGPRRRRRHRGGGGSCTGVSAARHRVGSICRGAVAHSVEWKERERSQELGEGPPGESDLNPSFSIQCPEIA
jgi:hypothetical protein